MLLPTVENALSQPGSDSYRWGFYLFRATYQDDALWERYITYIHENAYEYIEYGLKDERLSKQFKIYVIEGPDLDGASTEEVRQRFVSWRSNPTEGPSDIAPSNHADLTLKSYPLYVDEQCRESMRAHEKLVKGSPEEFDHSVLIKAMNAEPHWDEEDEEDSEDNEEESDEDEAISGVDYGHSNERDWKNPVYHWMLVSCRDLVCWWNIMSSESDDEWDRQYGLCCKSANEKRPWTEDSFDGPFYQYS